MQLKQRVRPRRGAHQSVAHQPVSQRSGTRRPVGRRGAEPRAPQRTRHRRVNHLLRTGHLLTASSVATSGLGAAYWVFVARWYDPDEVGRGYAAVSAMMFLAGFGQLNLANTLVRFIPSAGSGTTRLIRRVYFVAATVTALLAGIFVVAVRDISPQLGFLRSPLAGALFVLAAAAYAVFVVQDGALTGLVRADWVLLENAVFAVSKIVFMVALAAFPVAEGIEGSWYAALAVALLVTNWFLFTRAAPERTQRTAATAREPGPTPGYLAADLLGSLFWLVATTLMPIEVLDRVGATQSAYFSLAWMVAYTLFLLSANMGASLIVESGDDEAALAVNCRRVLRHSGRLLLVGVGVGTLGAPLLLRVFGPGYAGSAGWLLRLLLLSALPNLVVTCAVSACRARRRVWAAAAILACVCGGAIGCAVWLLPHVGITGVGYGWLIAESCVAGVLLVRRAWWMGRVPAAAESAHPGRAASGRLADLLQASTRRAVRLCLWPADRIAALHLVRAHDAAGPRWQAVAGALRAVRTPSDLLVVPVRREEPMAVKCARTDRAHQTLLRQHAVLAMLHADGRLGPWRGLLPRVIDGEYRSRPTWTVEGWLPGTSGTAMLRARPGLGSRLSGAAAEAIDGLHRATSRDEEVGAAHLTRWVDEPLALLEREMRLARPGPYTAAIDTLRADLHAGLGGRRLRIGWVHRDFHPGNVLFARDGRRVTGIVDWAGAVPDGPIDLDVRLFRLAVRRETEGRSFGDLVLEGLRREREQGETGLLLLAWLWHVTDNLEKSARFTASHLWTGRNVLDVLKAVAR
ncbi:phosphotransferase [Actinospica durhamensis]|uniref:Phosphotransferase n=1 Tax=Actinospica durhamensis TaxID=1508375 RepID=A0A941EQ84_9ACTN|nr:phosphotransferase [Actinospica durhamensis]MBR7835937.1 phosphotransferase [Actinospica durhamensis]